MDQSRQIVEVLKRELRQRRMTYAMLAERLELSEVSVKRMFASANFSLHRLDAVCELLGLSVGDLARRIEQLRPPIDSLTREQEQELVSDRGLLLVATLVRAGWSLEQMVAGYALTEPACIGHLVRLDRLKLIELLPGNRYRQRISADFRWLPGGPIEQLLMQQIQSEFLHARFAGEQSTRWFFSGHLDADARARVNRQLEQVARTFNDEVAASAANPDVERENVGLLLAMRPWQLSTLTAMKRAPD